MFLESPGKARLIRIAVWVAVLGLLLGVLSSLIMAASADAHAVLRSISPKDGATLTTAPKQVVLTFDEPISTSFATVTVTGPSGPASEGKAVVEGAVVTQALRTGLVNGNYTIAFRVVSEDGHPISDTSSFGVAAPPYASPATDQLSPAPSASTAGAGPAGTPYAPVGDADAGGASDGRPVRIGLAVGVAALALAAGTALVASTRRRSGE